MADKEQKAETSRISLICDEKIETIYDCYTEILDLAIEQTKDLTMFKKLAGEREIPRFSTVLGPDDVKLLNELGHLSADKLMEYIRTLQNTSAALAKEEAAQFARARCLGIFGK